MKRKEKETNITWSLYTPPNNPTSTSPSIQHYTPTPSPSLQPFVYIPQPTTWPRNSLPIYPELDSPWFPSPWPLHHPLSTTCTFPISFSFLFLFFFFQNLFVQICIFKLICFNFSLKFVHLNFFIRILSFEFVQNRVCIHFFQIVCLISFDEMFTNSFAPWYSFLLIRLSMFIQTGSFKVGYKNSFVQIRLLKSVHSK